MKCYQIFLLISLAASSSATWVDEADYVRLRSKRAVPEETTETNSDRASSRNRTELCDEAQLKQVVADHSACYRKAEANMLPSIAADNDADLFSGLCKVIRAKADCISTFAPKCLSREKANMMRSSYLHTEVTRANENSDPLGQDFIDSCQELKGYQNEFVGKTFGSDKCSYEEAYNMTMGQEECKLEALIKKRERESIAVDFLTNLDRESKTTILNNLYCVFQRDWLNCYQQTTFKCSSKEKQQEVLEAERKDFKSLEKNFHEMGIKISFKNCNNDSQVPALF